MKAFIDNTCIVMMSILISSLTVFGALGVSPADSTETHYQHREYKHQ